MNPYLSTCNIVNNYGTGVGNCDLKDLGDFIGFDMSDKDVKIDFSDTDAEATYNNYVLAKKLFTLNDLFDFDQTTPDNETTKSSIGITYEMREGKIMFTVIFYGSHCFHRALYFKKSYGKYNYYFKFQEHYVGAKTTDKLSLKGFDGGMFSPSSFKLKKGTDGQQTKVTFELTPVGTYEWNTALTGISITELGFNPNLVNGVIETVVEYATAPTATTTVVVDVKSACSGAPIQGIPNSASWKLGGTQATPRTVSSSAESTSIAGRYTLTLSGTLADDDTVAPYLNNGTYNAVEDIGGNKFAGQAELATV